MSEEVEHRVINIALFVADTLPPKVTEKSGDYDQLEPRLLKEAMASIPRFRHHFTAELNVVPFFIRNADHYPSTEELAEGKWDAILITGSTSHAFEENAWTKKVVEFVRYVVEEHPLVRILGICWGHQIVARAFGAKVETNPQGWEVRREPRPYRRGGGRGATFFSVPLAETVSACLLLSLTDVRRLVGFFLLLLLGVCVRRWACTTPT